LEPVSFDHLFHHLEVIKFTYRGGDIHVSLDGNFNHRHLRSAGECLSFFRPEYFISKVQVDAVGARIERLRKTPKKSCNPKVPDEAVDECESGHTAGSGSTVKTNMDKFDDAGIMLLGCRHDIPLFFANIDSPGEQQKYAVALLEHLFSFLPASAHVIALYDVGCVLDRSLQLVSQIVKFRCYAEIYFPSIHFSHRISQVACYLEQVPCIHMLISGPVS